MQFCPRPSSHYPVAEGAGITKKSRWEARETAILSVSTLHCARYFTYLMFDGKYGP